MINKVVIVSISELSYRIKKNLFIEEFEAEGVEVVFLDVSKLIGLNNRVLDSRVVVVNSQWEYEELIKSYSDSPGVVFNMQIYYEKRWEFLFKSLRLTNNVKYYVSFGVTPTKFGFKEIIKKIISQNKYLGFSFDAVFYQSEAAGKRFLRRSKIFKAPLIEERRHENKKTQIGVFVDQYHPIHPDFEISKKNITLTRKEYCAKVSDLFDEIEAELDIKIIVAAHPKGDYLDGQFGNREIKTDLTQSLVAESSIVIASYSTIIMDAVYYDKDILFIYTDISDGFDIKGEVFSYTTRLDCKALHLSDKFDLKYICRSSSTAYKRFKNEYVPVRNVSLEFSTTILQTLNKLDGEVW